jgi:hypothetical protein
LTPALALAYADALTAAGHEVHIVQQEDEDEDLDPVVGGLDNVAQLARDLCRENGATIMLDLHYEPRGFGGMYAIVPDATGLDPSAAGDTWEDNTMDRELARAVAVYISQRTGLPLRRTPPVREAGVLSETQTGIGLQGARLAMFAATADLDPRPVRLVIEHGALDQDPDRDIIAQDGFAEEAAAGAVEAIADVF